jgi:hypothetical protein
MTVIRYRLILVASVAAALLSAGLSLITSWLPPDLRAYMEAANDAPLAPMEVVAGSLGLLSALAALVACVGLWRFRHWGRSLAVIATVVGLAAGLGFGPTVQSVWAQFIYDASSLLWGALLAVSYWSALSDRFVRAPAA